MKSKKYFFLLFIILLAGKLSAQAPLSNTFSYTNPQEYIIQDISFSGLEYLDKNTLQAMTGLNLGDKILVPGEDISNAIKKLWDRKIIGDVSVSVTKIEGNKIWLNFHLTERPRISKIDFTGVKKADQEELRELTGIRLGQVITDAAINRAQERIEGFYQEKGFLNAEVNIKTVADTAQDNHIALKVNVDRKDRVRINEIIIKGNEGPYKTEREAKLLSDARLKRQLKETREKKLRNILSPSKFIQEEFEKDKESLKSYYKRLGYRDVELSDSIYRVSEDRINVQIEIEEGPKYYFRNISWKGNYVYSDRFLDTLLNIRKGDIYNPERLERKLNFNPEGVDISSLYLDEGYLFFNIDPVEVLVENDSIDLEFRIYEGPQATIRNVTVSGNTKTHDHVIMRELRTLPGQKFSRADLIRSQREIAALGYFDPQQIGINPVPNPADGTVDINYTVVEKPSDQIELSGGWGGTFRFVGTLGLVFNNFSLRNVPHIRKWDPLPSGDGQRLSIRFQANGRQFQTYMFSFTEPWLGGNKPHSLTFSLTRSQQNRLDRNFEVDGYLRLQGGTVSYGKRLKWPDDFFSLNHSVSFMQYDFNNYGENLLGIDNTTSNTLTYSATLSRNNLDDFVYPTTGSNNSLTMTLTPPYSLFSDKNFGQLPPKERFKLVEYHKWMFDNSWFTTLASGPKRKLVFNARAHFGFIGKYKESTGIGPFERFQLGGDGLSGFNFLLGSDIIGLRGYPNNSIKPMEEGGPVSEGGVIFNKFVMELRYPISLSPAFSIFALGFVEGGNNWGNFKEFNPLRVYRTAGIGTRIMMPAFGMIGIDWGYPLDNIPGVNLGRTLGERGHITFTIGQQIR